MGFGLAYWKRGLVLAIPMAAAITVRAQGAAPGSGQAIIFSAPEDQAISNRPSLSPQPPESARLQNVFEVPPTFNLNRLPGSGPLPSLGPKVSSGMTARAQELLDRRNNWELLTPAEILGAATPEKILGITERDAFGQEKNASALERYNERQQAMSVRTNATDLPPDWSLSGDDNLRSNLIYSGSFNPVDPANPLFKSREAGQPRGGQKEDENNSWSRLFGQPPPPAPAPDAESQMNMNRFRQLLNPGSSSIAAGTTPSSGGIKTSLPQTLLGSGLDQASTPRAGASYAPLKGVGRAPELPRLPGAWNLNYTSPPPAAVWSPQAAPWLSTEPQPLAVPQRKF